MYGAWRNSKLNTVYIDKHFQEWYSWNNYK